MLIKDVLTEKQKHTILYIEDNLTNIKLVSHILARQTHINLITAHEAELGLTLASKYYPELILLDINMPGLNGYEVLSILQADELLKDIPVVAVTANAMLQDIEQGKAAGFRDYLSKPLDFNLFLKTIDRYISKDSEV